MEEHRELEVVDYLLVCRTRKQGCRRIIHSLQRPRRTTTRSTDIHMLHLHKTAHTLLLDLRELVPERSRKTIPHLLVVHKGAPM
jgi:hypothetical protein